LSVLIKIKLGGRIGKARSALRAIIAPGMGMHALLDLVNANRKGQPIFMDKDLY